MFKEINFTLYDIFGYLLPGAVAFSALTIVAWAIFWPASSLDLPSSFTVVQATGLLFAMYMCGHALQGLGNILEAVARKYGFMRELPLSAEAGELLLTEAALRFGPSVKSLSSRELFTLCDQTLIHHGSPGEREIFIYREGFYRGVSLALYLLSAAFLIRMTSRPVLISIFGINSDLCLRHLFFAAALSGAGAFFAFRRYVRFAEHYRRTVSFRFLALAKAGFKTEEKGKGD